MYFLSCNIVSKIRKEQCKMFRLFFNDSVQFLFPVRFPILMLVERLKKVFLGFSCFINIRDDLAIIICSNWVPLADIDILL